MSEWKKKVEMLKFGSVVTYYFYDVYLSILHAPLLRMTASSSLSLSMQVIILLCGG
jgi:hypothetical protein